MTYENADEYNEQREAIVLKFLTGTAREAYMRRLVSVSEALQMQSLQLLDIIDGAVRDRL